jgi:hypothetical protein
MSSQRLLAFSVILTLPRNRRRKPSRLPLRAGRLTAYPTTLEHGSSQQPATKREIGFGESRVSSRSWRSWTWPSSRIRAT